MQCPTTSHSNACASVMHSSLNTAGDTRAGVWADSNSKDVAGTLCHAARHSAALCDAHSCSPDQSTMHDRSTKHEYCQASHLWQEPQRTNSLPWSPPRCRTGTGTETCRHSTEVFVLHITSTPCQDGAVHTGRSASNLLSTTCPGASCDSTVLTAHACWPHVTVLLWATYIKRACTSVMHTIIKPIYQHPCTHGSWTSIRPNACKECHNALWPAASQ